MDDQPTPPASPPQAAPLPQLLARWRKPLALPAWGAWLLSLTAALALWLAYGQWKRLNHLQERLAQQSAATQAQAIEARSLSQQAQALAQQAATRSSLSEARINEYTLQRSHLEQLAFELSRTRDEAMLIDIEASLRLAQQQAQLTGLADPLIAALRNASHRLQRAEQPRLTPIVAAIDRDLARLTGTAVTDTAGLLGRMDALLLQLESLPLGNAVGAAPRKRAVRAPVAISDHEAQALGLLPGSAAAPQGSAQAQQPPQAESAPAQPPQAPAPQTTPGAAEAPAPAAVNEAQADAPGDEGGFWAGLRQSFRGLVRVQRIEHPDAALLTQEQAFFLRENLRLQLMNARMALLARQSASARTDLAGVQALLRKYYDLDAPRTRQALRTLQQLQEHIQAVQPPAITDTLLAIAAAQEAPRQAGGQGGAAHATGEEEGGNAAASAAANNPQGRQ
ncbi:uroporphyrinogen-III C-methyltransferase [Vandammella animalimorsus]|uniref:uroporphyrinogen-III C-methyltransferase n=1 Tax=Vandammella animalimorsus TaxID=2029117 RepID=UPI001177F919|nr:uroporphyrinogen-III C-methyltransferase [Vandammella animalimorsus]